MIANEAYQTTPDVEQRRASDPCSSAWVGASAGTGKTKVLTDRVLRILLQGTRPSAILCLTFTKAAAAEMAIRINKKLGEWVTLDDDDLSLALKELTGEIPEPEVKRKARRLFAEVLDCPGGMRIETIHAFCQALLRRFPLEAGVAPHFAVLDERSAMEMLSGAHDTLLRQAGRVPDSVLGKALAYLSERLSEDDFTERMGDIVKERGQLKRLFAAHGGLDGMTALVGKKLGVKDGEDEQSIITASLHDPNFDEDGLRRVCAYLSEGSPTDQERGIAIACWLDDKSGGGFDDYCGVYLTEKGTIRRTLMTAGVVKKYPQGLDILQAEAQRLLAVQEKIKASRVATSTMSLLVVADALLAEYGRQKQICALLDYDDLIFATRDLLARPQVAPWVLYKLDGGLDHILIDEAQDTNPDHWQIIAALTEEFFAGAGARENQRTVFAVGDEKQSIYGFQRADPEAFALMKNHFAAKVVNAEKRWCPVDLFFSFRSTKAVLDVVDAVFRPDAVRAGVSEKEVHHKAVRRGQAGVVELWPLVERQEKSELTAWQVPTLRENADNPSERMAQMIADRIKHWLNSGEKLPSSDRKVMPSDIMVLVRRRNAFVEQLVRALKVRNVPVAGADRMVLTKQLCVMDLLALAEFLLLPEDDLALGVVLRGPLIGFGEDDLFELCSGRGNKSVWEALKTSRFSKASEYLAALLRLVDYVSPYDLLAQILELACPADSVSGRRAILKRLGEEALDPLDEFMAAALAFDASHPPSLQGFVHWMTASETQIKRELERGDATGGGKVRIMTVHGAKGLQAPIVFLPDTTSVPSKGPDILWPASDMDVPLFAARRGDETHPCAEVRDMAKRKQDEEYRRLLYVAMTRAEDRLYVCGCKGKNDVPESSWYGLVSSAMKDIAAPVEIAGLGTVMRYDNPQTEKAQKKTDLGDRESSAATLPDWAYRAMPDEPSPPRPLAPSKTAGDEPPVRSPLDGDDQHRFLRGTLIHRLLQSLPSLGDESRAVACDAFLLRHAADVPKKVRHEIRTQVMAVLDDARFGRIFAVVIIPGLSLIFGLPMIALATQMVMGGQTPIFPDIINCRTIPREALDKGIRKGLVWVERSQRYVRPRFLVLSSPNLDRVNGLVCLAMALMMAWPIPFLNLIPTVGILMVALGLLERDGLFVAIGYTIAVLSACLFFYIGSLV